MYSITFRYLTSLVVDKKLETRLIDVVILYLYSSLDIDIYMRIHVGLVKFQNFQRQIQCFKLEMALYGFKHADRM